MTITLDDQQLRYACRMLYFAIIAGGALIGLAILLQRK